MVSASPATPQGHVVAFKLIAADGAFVDTFDYNLTVGTYNYLIWNPDPTPSPGELMHDILISLGYTGNHSITLPPGDDLRHYQSILVCLGVPWNRYIIFALSPEASALVDYLNSGGRMYLEGADVWYDDLQFNSYDFGPLFGINAASGGSGDLKPVIGEPGTFTEGMYFNNYIGGNMSIDHIDPTGTGFLIFHDGNNNYNCGVANDAGTYRTVGTSFELAYLIDGSGVSTRAVLLDSIMHFFGVFPTGVEEVTKLDVITPKLSLYPNPFSDKINIRYSIAQSAKGIELKIYDATGRLVRSIPIINLCNPNKSVVSVCWDGKDDSGHKVSSGIYFVTLETEDFRDTKKVIVVE